MIALLLLDRVVACCPPIKKLLSKAVIFFVAGNTLPTATYRFQELYKSCKKIKKEIAKKVFCCGCVVQQIWTLLCLAHKPSAEEVLCWTMGNISKIECNKRSKLGEKCQAFDSIVCVFCVVTTN